MNKPIGRTIDRTVRITVSDAVYNTVRITVGDAVYNTVRDAVRKTVYRAVNDVVLEDERIYQMNKSVRNTMMMLFQKNL